MQIIHTYLAQQSQQEAFRRTLYQTLLILSLLVTVGVFWGLKLTGITMAGEAFCGMDEHNHSDKCLRGQLICQLPEAEPHTHTEACLFNEIVCPLQEGDPHTHTEACHEQTLICQKEESDS